MKQNLKLFILQIRQKSGEHEQALLRVFFSLILVVYLGLFAVKNEQGIEVVSIFAIFYLIYSLLLASLVYLSPEPSQIRLRISMLSDIIATTFGLLMTHENGVLVYGIYLWVIVGNGLRYGSKALFLSYIASVIGFSIVILANEYWHSHLVLSIGLLLPLLLVPLYVLKLRNQLEQALHHAQQANKAKSQFLAHMSHEMRTPLNGLVGVSDLLTATPLNEDQYDLVRTLQNSTKILRQLIDNVLDLSKVESGKLISENTAFDLHQLVNNVVELFMHQAQAKGLRLNIRFTPETAFSLIGDELHLLQVIINLLGNALKFTDQGGVELRISTVHQDQANTRLRFEVIDTGIGIAANAQNKIFEQFTQASSAITRQYGGTGLGTTISLALVKLMNGEMGLQSELGIGSVFWFELPFAKQVIEPTKQAPTALEQLHVISIGLDIAENTLLAKHLASWHIRFSPKASLAQFFAVINQLQVSQRKGLVVVCAPENLGMSAQDFAHQVQRVDMHQSIALINIQSPSQHDTQEELTAMGYCCQLCLPLDKTLLFNALHGVMSPAPMVGVVSFKEHYERNSLEQRGVRVLLADDNGTNRKIIARMLEHGGHRVELASDGMQALDKLERLPIDLMILDMNMPQLGGLDVLKIYRATQLHARHIPVIILTADVTLEAKQACEASEIDAYITKPVDTRTLLDTVARLLAAHGQAEAMATVPTSSLATEATALINEQTLQQLALLDKEQESFLLLVIHGYISETEKLLFAMRTSLANQEYATFKEQAHILKGSSGNVGADAMGEIAQTILQKNHAQLAEDASDLLQQAQMCFKLTRSSLTEYLGGCARASI